MSFEQVFKKSSALFAAMLLMISAWSMLHLPGASLQMVTFAILSATALCNISSFDLRLRRTAFMVCGAAGVQFLMGVTADYPTLRIILSGLASFFILYTAPNRQTAIIILLAGYLTLFSVSGFSVSLNRCFDIAFSGAVVLAVTALGNLFAADIQKKAVDQNRYTLRHSAIITSELTVGFIISQMFRHEQSAWIMLTVLFIHLAKTQKNSLPELSGQRVAAAPAGILLAGIFLASFCNIDYRFIYVIPFTGTLSFFMLYLKGDYFTFTLLFMFTITVFTDWMLGTGHRFHFNEIMFSRCIATSAGAMLLFCGSHFMKEELS